MSKTVGYVVGEVRTDEFTFVTSKDIAPPRLEYIVVRVNSPAGQIQVLAQVTGLSVSSRVLDTTLSYSEVESILSRLQSSPPIIVGQAKVLGYLEGTTVRFPRHAASPGSAVEHAPDELLQRFFSTADSGIEIGTLINRDNVPVLLNPNGLRRHLAVIAQTGAGKSYTVGVILEKLLQLGGTIIVFDPNSDYVLMRKHRDEKRNTPFADRVQVYRLPSSQVGRISDGEIGGSKKYTMRFSDLEPDEICAMSGIGETSTNIRKAIRDACSNLHGMDYTVRNLMQELERLARGDEAEPPRPAARDNMPRGPRQVNPAIGDPEEFSREFNRVANSKAGIDHDLEDEETDWNLLGRRDSAEAEPEETAPTARNGRSANISMDAMLGAGKALKYVEKLDKIDIWGYEQVPIQDLLQPMELSVIDLAGVDHWVTDFLVNKVLTDTWREATTQGLARPVFFVLEEAHNFVPGGQGAHSLASAVIKRIASEGRKFGLFLVLITQRPYKVHGDTLSQCNSQIIMRLTNPQDQQAIKQSSEGISEGLLNDLPGLNVGEAVVLGPLVRVPVMVRIGERASKEGGNDIDVIQALERARSDAITVGRERRSRDAAQKRVEWKEEIDT